MRGASPDLEYILIVGNDEIIPFRVANTAYGYGDANAIGYSEQLMQLFVRSLREGATVGEALRQAKSEYFNSIGTSTLTPYDEKVLAVATFYGFPMYQVQLPTKARTTEAVTKSTKSTKNLSEPLTSCPEGLTCREATFTPLYATETVSDGTYFSIAGETEEVNERPILPRTSLPILSTSISNTLQITVARGALFEGGHYETFTNFDPVITRIITESTDHQQEELPYSVEAWRPAEWERINSLRTGNQITQRLVVTPLQYRATTDRYGTARRFSDMTYTIYYSNTRDSIPPSIWQVGTFLAEKRVEVNVTDFSDIARTVLTVTTGDGVWQSLDMTQKSGAPNHWEADLPQHPYLAYFVQAVDRAGNVAIHDNKGRYFEPFGPYLKKVYLPLIISDGRSR